MALAAPIARIIIDNEDEMELLNALAGERGVTADVLLRITPAVDPHTHTFIKTGIVDTKFGLGIGTGQAAKGLRKLLALPNLRLHGFHAHLGSQLLDISCFELGIKLVAEFLAAARAEVGITISELNLGGGLGIKYVAEHRPPTIAEFAEYLIRHLTAQFAAHDLPLPTLMLEPGRSLVGEAGTTLYTVGPIKEIPGVRTYVNVDGGLADNPRPALYDAKYAAILANDACREPLVTVTIVGRHCETDTLITDLVMPQPRLGDLLAVQSTGAYNYAMSSNYNRYPRPAVVLVNDGEADVIVRGETLDDITSHDVIPERLR